jgi:hypothetical protein
MRKLPVFCLAAAALAGGLAAAGLSSCSSSRVNLIVGPASPQLRQELSKLAAEYSSSKGLRIALDGKPSSPRGTVITIVWSFVPPKDDGKLFVVSPDAIQKSGYSTALAFERLCRTDKGWREVPILWDAWGIAYSPGKSTPLGDVKTFDWKDRGTYMKARQSIMAPGGEPGVRQSLYWLADAEFPEQAELAGILLGGAERSGQASRSYFKSFVTLGKEPSLSHGSLNMMKPDVENLARNTRVDLLYGSYEWLRGVQGTGRRDFRALVYPLSQGYAMPVSVLTVSVRGAGASAAKAQDFLIWLLSPEKQKELSDLTGYMAANFNAANLDLNSLGARNAAIGAARMVPIDPEPTKGSASEAWDSLLERVLSKPSEWERVVAEKEKQ